MSGTLIYDNIMVAFKMVHHLKNKRQGNKREMAIKLDLSKAFDRVEWNFLEEVMQAIGLPSKWVQRVMTCVHSIEYLIMVNGSLTKKFTPSRRIRQGDTLSPLLFLLCVKGLLAMLSDDLQTLKGAVVCRGGLRISHLFFAYDNLLFGTASKREAHKLLNIL